MAAIGMQAVVRWPRQRRAVESKVVERGERAYCEFQVAPVRYLNYVAYGYLQKTGKVTGSRTAHFGCADNVMAIQQYVNIDVDGRASAYLTSYLASNQIGGEYHRDP